MRRVKAGRVGGFGQEKEKSEQVGGGGGSDSVQDSHDKKTGRLENRLAQKGSPKTGYRKHGERRRKRRKIQKGGGS